MPGPVKLIDNAVKDEILRFPTVELIRRLFPDIKIKGRAICNPLRDDRHPSLSCFRDYSGCQRWKDHATGETGDNIDFFRKVYPELGYVEAVDRLSLLVLGKSVLQDFVPGESVPVYSDARRFRMVHSPHKEDSPVLVIKEDVPYSAGSAPSELVDYTRSRGISDEVASVYLRCVTYLNENRKGRSVIDPASGLPVLDESGNILKDDGLFRAVAMPNDIGGYSLRVPPGPEGSGFKGTNVSFITTILSSDVKAAPVTFFGEGDGFVTGFGYFPETRSLFINRTQGFSGVEPWAVRAAMVFLDTWIGRFIEGRERKGAEAVLSRLNGPVANEVDVVEGMFDAVSVIEFEKLSGRGVRPSRDIVVLNSISNIHWAVPFLSIHGIVRSLLDNDLRSSAGQKAFDLLSDRVGAFSARLGGFCTVRSDSGVFYPYKDINDYLKVRKGFVVEKPEPSPSGGKSNKTQKSVALSGRNSNSNQIKP